MSYNSLTIDSIVVARALHNEGLDEIEFHATPDTAEDDPEFWTITATYGSAVVGTVCSATGVREAMCALKDAISRAAARQGAIMSNTITKHWDDL